MRGFALGALLLIAACTQGGEPESLGNSGLGVADAALRGGSAEIALQVTGNILAKSPNNTQALVIQGEALTELGRLPEAEASFNAALADNRRSIRALVGLGRVKLASDPRAAEALFLEALQREPRNAVAFNDLGIARDLQGRHADAQSAYRQALAVDSEMNGAQVNLALSMAMSGQSGDAIRLLRPLASNPGASPQVRHDLAAVLVMSGDRTGAEQILSKDLSPPEVKQALAAYAAAGRDNGAALLGTAAPAEAPAQAAAASPAAPPPATKPVAEAPPKVAVATPPPPPASPPPAAAAPAPVVQASVAPQAPAPAPEPQPEPTAAPAAQAATVQTNATQHGSAQVQLGAVPSEHAAQQAWHRLQQKMPDQFSGHEPIIAKAERDGRVFWRLRTGGFSDMADAVSFCDRVRQGGSDCMAMR
jgi:Flp pilus assembly protein TadD